MRFIFARSAPGRGSGGGLALPWKSIRIRCFTTSFHIKHDLPSQDQMVGLMPGMLAELKATRNDCKRAGKAAKAAGNRAEEVFWDLSQAAVKVLMNGAYGGLGARQGGVFIDAAALAAAVTACGRRLIVGVSHTVESIVWLHAPTDTGGIDGIGEPAPAGFTRATTVYGARTQEIS